MSAAAGAEHANALLWCVVAAAVVAWGLNDAAAALAVRSGGESLGSAVRALSPRAAAVLAILLLAGSLAYECNIFAGTVAAVEVVTDDARARGAVAALNGPLCAALILSGSTATVSAALGGVVVLMVLLFAATACIVGVQPGFARGLLPSFPEGSAPVALALMGTTAVPLNLFLGSALARGQRLASVREGVAVASALTGLICALIQAVGAYAHAQRAAAASPAVVGGGWWSGAEATGSGDGGGSAPFSLVDLGDVLRRLVGDAGAATFAVGLYFAGISSALTIPLGSAIAVEDLAGWSAAAPAGGGARHCSSWASGGRAGLQCALVFAGTLPSLARVDTMAVIILAQVVNGMLLPLAAASLVVALNDRALMGAHVHSALSNALLAPCIGVACFLAAVVLVGSVGGADSVGAQLAPAACITVAGLAGLALLVRRARRDGAATRGADSGRRRIKVPGDEVAGAREGRGRPRATQSRAPTAADEWTPHELCGEARDRRASASARDAAAASGGCTSVEMITVDS